MKLKILIFMVLTASVYAQKFDDVCSGLITNGSNLESNTLVSLRTSSGNTFDTLRVYIQGGENSTDSIRCAVFVQSGLFGRWSQDIFIDSLVLGNTPTIRSGSIVKYLDSSSTNGGNGVRLYNDTLKNRWFLGQSIPTAAKTFLFSHNGWQMRIVVRGRALTPPLSGNYPSSGVRVKVFRLSFP